MITFHFHLQPQYKYELFHINFTYAVICWKLDRECHVDFCMFLTPHELNFELLIKTLKRKWKGMRKSCLVYCYSGIQSLFEVVLLYTFYTTCRKCAWPGALIFGLITKGNLLYVKVLWSQGSDLVFLVLIKAELI